MLSKKLSVHEKRKKCREYDRKWRLKDPEHARALALKRKHKGRKRNKQIILDYKNEHPCTLCRESDPCCLSFHHANPNEKIDSVYKLAKAPCSLGRLVQEINKCIMLCENCHRRLHWSEYGKKYDDFLEMPKHAYSLLGAKEWRRRYKYKQTRLARKFIYEIKLKSVCRCGECHPACLDFHHKDEHKKQYQISYMARDLCSIKRIKLEIAKCIILCANCHRKYHANSHSM